MSQRQVPAITHLQFLVLFSLRASPRLGRQIRRELARRGVRRSPPAFYQMMARLESVGFVSGAYDQKIVDGQIIKERSYALTPAGRAAWQATRDFYVENLKEAGAIAVRRKRPAHA